MLVRRIAVMNLFLPSNTSLAVQAALPFNSLSSVTDYSHILSIYDTSFQLFLLY